MSNADYFRARVDEALRAAEGEPLANVRERCLRAADAWEAMAQRALRTDRHRAEEASRRALRDDAAALAASAALFTRPETAG